MKRIIIMASAVFLLSCNSKTKNHITKDPEVAVNRKPNIIVFYVDDLGFGDLSSYGATQVATPNVDRLAQKGILFTDAHSTSATCTPSRYSLLTGEYAFRNKAAVLPGDAPLLINPEKPTLPDILKKAGYKTAVVGKWHLGLGDGVIDWNDKIEPGPNNVGFDYSFILPATGDRVPTVYVEDGYVMNRDANDLITVSYEEKIGDKPTGTENPELMRYKADIEHSNTIVNGVSRIGFMNGGEKALWTDEDFSEVFTSKAKSFIEMSKNESFFLFFSFHDIHVPRLPHSRFHGKSKMGLRGDAIVQMDWMTGAIMDHLEMLGISENTLVIFTSDNGPVLNDGYEDGAVEQLSGHSPSGIYNGGKYSAYEGGTRIPLIVYWPKRIKKPKQSEALISQVDLFASLANITGNKLQNTEAIDSKDLSDVLIGETSMGRKFLLQESFTFGLRKGDWKYIEPHEKNSVDFIKRKGINSGASIQDQLFNLKTDTTESKNLSHKYPLLLIEMKDQLEMIKNRELAKER